MANFPQGFGGSAFGNSNFSLGHSNIRSNFGGSAFGTASMMPQFSPVQFPSAASSYAAPAHIVPMGIATAQVDHVGRGAVEKVGCCSCKKESAVFWGMLMICSCVCCPCGIWKVWQGFQDLKNAQQ